MQESPQMRVGDLVRSGWIKGLGARVLTKVVVAPQLEDTPVTQEGI